MTREERDNALKVLKNYDLNFHKINGMLFSAEEIANAFDMAIKALEQEPRKDEVILTKEEYGELVSSEFDNGYAKGYREALEQEPILDKIRDQIKSNLRGVEITLEVLVENDPLRPKMEGAKDTLEECLEIIDRAESEG